MKKTLAILLSSMLLFSAMTGCSNNDDTKPNYDTTNGQTKNADYSTVSNCTFSGVITQIKESSMSYVGGIIGVSEDHKLQ